MAFRPPYIDILNYPMSYDPPLQESKLSGRIPLKDCTVAEVDDKSDATTSVKQHIKRNRFSLTTASGKQVVMTAPTAEDRLSWLQTIRKVIMEFTSP